MTTLSNSHPPPTMSTLPSVSSLMSPPEAKPFDSFSTSDSPLTMAHHHLSPEQDGKLPPITESRKRNQSELDLPSPPVTPHTSNKKRRSTASDRDSIVDSAQDPVLFPRNEPASGVSNDEPLFGPALPPEAESLVDQHINLHMARFKNKANKPTRDEYYLALSCVPVVATQFNRDPVAWAKQERETLERQWAMMNRHRPAEDQAKLKRLAPATTKKQPATQPSSTRVPRTPRPKRTPRSTPTQRVYDNFNSRPSPPPKPARAVGSTRDDTDYRSLKDYSPPLETLAGNAKALKADWKGQMLDLSNDPDRHMLDPAELHLAATLRLSCATYLCSKRRIFEARVRALAIGKEFRKTDAQQACKIDVNKASKLWTAFDRVGWFDPKYFEKYLK